MGDSGSQLIGFTLAALGLAVELHRRVSTVATLLLPVLVLAVPILDTTLVTVVRLLEGRPVSQGGRDHSSHRLVSLGVSETGAVVLLALISAALGATSLAYEAFGNGRLAAVGVLVTFALLVQFGEPPRRRRPRARERPAPRFLVLHTPARRGAVDGALIGGVVPRGVPAALQRPRHRQPAPLLPAHAPGRSCSRATWRCIAFGLYAGVWRYASSRDALRAATAVVVSEIAAIGYHRADAGTARRFLAQRLRDRRAHLRGGDRRSRGSPNGRSSSCVDARLAAARRAAS